MTDDLIGGATSPEEVSSTASSAVEELVGEGKKFKDVDSLATAKKESDSFIEQLKFENDNMRKELGELAGVRENSKTIEDVLNALQTRESAESGVNHTTGEEANVEDVVRNVLNQEQTKQKAVSNRSTVNNAISNRFGGDAEKAKEFIKQTVAKSGMNGQQFQDLVDSAPEAAMSVLGMNSKSNQPNVSISAMGTQGDAPSNGTQVRDAAYYKTLKSEMGFNKFYGDIKLQQQMFKDVDSLGDDYFKE